jgi:hypothetical protein
MAVPCVQLTIRQLMLWVVTLALICALPRQLFQILRVEPARKGAFENEMRARQRLDYAANDRQNAASHLSWHAYYVHEAERRRREIGWGRLTLLALVGLEVGFLAWQLRLRWAALAFSVASITGLTILAEVHIRLPWEAKLGLVTWAFILLPVFVSLMLPAAVIGAVLWRRSRSGSAGQHRGGHRGGQA